MQAAELLAVEPGDGDALIGVDPLQVAAAQAFAAGHLVPPGFQPKGDSDRRSLLTAQKYQDEALADATDVISARILGGEQPAELLTAQQQQVDADDGDARLLLVTRDVDATTEINTSPSSFPTFLRGDTIDDPTAVAGRQSGDHGRRLTIADVAKWISPDSMLLGGVLVFLAVGLAVNKARRRQKLKTDALERDVLDGQGRPEDDQQDHYVVLM